MSHDANDDSYDYDENEGIDDDEIDSLNKKTVKRIKKGGIYLMLAYINFYQKKED